MGRTKSPLIKISNFVRLIKRKEEFMVMSGNIIGDIGESTKIYRIFSRKRFLNLFEENLNAVVLPTKWEDPFENVILKADVINECGERGRFDFHADVYGQCWTLETASDAMWQIYSPNKDAVRVRTTVGKLINSMVETHEEWADSTCFVGRVKYLTENKLKHFGQTVFKNGIDPDAIARSILVKRKAYKHEKEVRLIYIERFNTKHPNGVYKYRLSPREIINQVVVDGRVKHRDFVPFKKQIMGLTGLSGKQVKRSLLYRQPKDFVVKVP